MVEKHPIFFISIVFLILMCLAGCSVEQDLFLKQGLSSFNETMIFGAQTQSPPMQTEMAKAAQTSMFVAQVQSVPVQTEVAKAAQMAASNALNLLATQAPLVKGTLDGYLAYQTIPQIEIGKGVALSIAAQIIGSLSASSHPINPVPPPIFIPNIQVQPPISIPTNPVQPPNSNSPGKQPTIIYFALGDSIASGYGLMDDGSECHRSNQSYPYQVKTFLEQRYESVFLYHFACAGATAARPKDYVLKLDKFKWLKNQVDEMLGTIAPDQPTVITITIGANDAGWDNTSVAEQLYVPSNMCYAWIDAIRSKVALNLNEQLSRILSQRPNVVVILTQAYNPFNGNGSLFIKYAGLGITRKDPLSMVDFNERARRMVDGINNGLFSDVFVPLGSPGNVRVIPNNVLFSGHEAPSPFCGNEGTGMQDTWIQYPGDPGSNADLPLWMKTLTSQEHGDCIHPNQKGAQAIAGQINETLLNFGR